MIVSACLLGVRCRWDGSDRLDPEVAARASVGGLVPVCPEQLGGLPTPRHPAEITGGTGDDVLRGTARVIDRTGRDVTDEFVRGGEETLRLARALGVCTAILKEASPSCGVHCLRTDGRLVPGRGVAAALLAAAGVELRAGGTRSS